MKSLLPLLIINLACAPKHASTASADSTEVARIVQERLAAGLVGDTATWHRHVSDSALWTGPALQPVLTSIVLPIIAANTSLRPGKQTMRGLEVHLFGDVAQATYVQLVAGPTGGEREGKRFRKTDIFQRRQSGWTLVGAVEIAVPFRPVRTISADRAKAIVGRYALPEVDTLDISVAAPGFRLTGLDGSHTDLLAANDSTLFEEGDPGDWIFHAGPRGGVESLIYRMQGGADVVLARVRSP